MSGSSSDSSDSSDDEEGARLVVATTVSDAILNIRTLTKMDTIQVPSDADEREISNLLQEMELAARRNVLLVPTISFADAHLTPQHMQKIISLLPQNDTLRTLILTIDGSNAQPLATILQLLEAFATPDERGEVANLTYLSVSLSDVGYEPGRWSETFGAILNAFGRTKIAYLAVNLQGKFDEKEVATFQESLQEFNLKIAQTRSKNPTTAATRAAASHRHGNALKKARIEQDLSRSSAGAAGSAGTSRSSSPGSIPGTSDLLRASPSMLGGSPTNVELRNNFLNLFIGKYWDLYNKFVQIDADEDAHKPCTEEDQKRIDGAFRRLIQEACTAQAYPMNDFDKNTSILLQLDNMDTEDFMCIHPDSFEGPEIPREMRAKFKSAFLDKFARMIQDRSTPTKFYSGIKPPTKS